MIVSAKMVGKGKPFPDVFVECMRRLGCGEPARCMVIEDSVHGLRAARTAGKPAASFLPPSPCPYRCSYFRAGCYAVGVTTSLPRSFLEPEADLVVDSLSELHEVLGV